MTPIPRSARSPRRPDRPERSSRNLTDLGEGADPSVSERRKRQIERRRQDLANRRFVGAEPDLLELGLGGVHASEAGVAIELTLRTIDVAMSSRDVGTRAGRCGAMAAARMKKDEGPRGERRSPVPLPEERSRLHARQQHRAHDEKCPDAECREAGEPRFEEIGDARRSENGDCDSEPAPRARPDEDRAAADHQGRRQSKER